MSRTTRQVIDYAERQLIDQDEVRLHEVLVKLVKRARQTDEPALALAKAVVKQLREWELA